MALLIIRHDIFDCFFRIVPGSFSQILAPIMSNIFNTFSKLFYDFDERAI